MKKKVAILICALFLIMVTTVAMAGVGNIKLLVNGTQLNPDVAPTNQNGRVSVPVRILAEALGCDVQWDAANKAVIITKISGDKFLKGQNDPTQTKPSINTNFVKAADLQIALDDDADGDMCDYREGHNGGDSIANDSLVVDVRTQVDFEAGHIPGAIWIAAAEGMATPDSLAKLKEALAAHVKAGGKNEVVLYCYTSHTAGLAAGVLGAEGFNVKNMRFGYSIAWEGTRQADPTVFGPREDKDGNPVPYATPATK